MPTVLIADDHALLRSGVRQLLESEPGIDQIGEASSGRETLEALRERPWDLLILDINMPDRSGLDVLTHARAGQPDTRVRVLSASSERQYALNVLRAGASGYVNKEMAPEELLTAVRTVLRGRRYVTPILAELLLSALEADAEQPLHARLSEH